MADYDTLPGANNSTTTIPARMLTDAARVSYRNLEGSFESGEQATALVYFAYPVQILGYRVFVTKALAGTDAGTIEIQNSAGTRMTPNGLITLPASSALGTEANGSLVFTANTTIAAGGHVKVIFAKTTAGGRARVSLEYKPTT